MNILENARFNVAASLAWFSSLPINHPPTPLELCSSTRPQQQKVDPPPDSYEQTIAIAQESTIAVVRTSE